MKVLTAFLFIAIFSLAACGQNLRIMWTPNVSADEDGVSHYIIYKWEGDSLQQVNWQLSNMDSIGTLPHVQNFDGPYEFRTYFNVNKIIRAGLVVEDSLTRKSGMALTRFYDRPGDLTEIWIKGDK